MKYLLAIARILVGVLFIFSGVVKADDPLGLSYKMQEFFEAWGWTFLNDFSLKLSVLMIAFEIIAGVAVLLGWRMKLFSWLLLLLILFFTFLTSYVVFSGKIRTCGCFGDCIPLTPWQTFTKDIILTGLIFFIFSYRNTIRPLFKPGVSVALLLAAVVFAFASQGYMLKHLPLVDCLPWKPGKSIAAQMQPQPGTYPDSIVITYTYTRNGKEVSFTSDKFPADFDDSLYHLVKREDKVIREGNDQPPIKDFALKTASGNDTTQAIISRPGYTVLLFVRDLPERNTAFVNDFNWLKARFDKGLVVITPQPEAVLNRLGNKPGLSDQVLSCDFVAVKTASRNAVTLYLLKDGVIRKKWAYADFDKAQQELMTLDNK